MRGLYNVKLRRVRVTILAVEEQSTKFTAKFFACYSDPMTPVKESNCCTGRLQLRPHLLRLVITLTVEHLETRHLN
jgi:hypothetical protein